MPCSPHCYRRPEPALLLPVSALARTPKVWANSWMSPIHGAVPPVESCQLHRDLRQHDLMAAVDRSRPPEKTFLRSLGEMACALAMISDRLDQTIAAWICSDSELMPRRMSL